MVTLYIERVVEDSMAETSIGSNNALGHESGDAVSFYIRSSKGHRLECEQSIILQQTLFIYAEYDISCLMMQLSQNE